MLTETKFFFLTFLVSTLTNADLILSIFSAYGDKIFLTFLVSTLKNADLILSIFMLTDTNIFFFILGICMLREFLFLTLPDLMMV